MKQIKWGVIGCGGIAYRRTIPGMMLAENSELVAVMDTNFEAAQKVKKEFGAQYAFATVEEVLALNEIDAVYIATPVFCHKEQAMAAAKAKKHILLEKPMGLSLSESKEIADFCKAQGVKLGVGLMMRFSSYHQKMRELIANGVIGDVVSMRGQLTCWYPEIPGNWRQDKACSGGGALMDMGIHCIDLLQYISGTKAKTVTCFAQNQTFNYSADDSAALLMKMDSGATAYVDANFNIPDNAAQCRLEFYGTCGSILAEGTIGQVEAGKIELTVSDAAACYNAQQNRESVNDTRTVEVVTGNMYEKEISAFANAILEDTEPVITAEDGLFVQKIVETAYLASEEGVCKKV
ncbi:MAG: Gfo/Idh/MocA family oxidoreductase [Ruminococcaceae bacterium]|nr:Gfo/Idh/MocA family oxidoreductase [Oscillospiraceae bacterium]